MMKTPTSPSTGYPTVVLYGGDGKRTTMLVHRLVAFSHKSPPSKDLVSACIGGVVQVNHKDSNRVNNRVDNLEWCTVTHNNRHAYDSGMQDMSGRLGELHWLAVLNDELVGLAMRMKGSGYKEIEIARLLGVKRTTLASMFQGITWNHVTGLPKKRLKRKGKSIAE